MPIIDDVKARVLEGVIDQRRAIIINAFAGAGVGSPIGSIFRALGIAVGLVVSDVDSPLDGVLHVGGVRSIHKQQRGEN